MRQFDTRISKDSFLAVLPHGESRQWFVSMVQTTEVKVINAYFLHDLNILYTKVHRQANPNPKP